MAKRIGHLDVLGEVRRALRILRRVERFMSGEERRAKRLGEKRLARERRERAERGAAVVRGEDPYVYPDTGLGRGSD